MRPARLLRGGPVRIRSCRSVFTAAGPLRCASGPGDPQSLSLDCVPLSTCPALGASATRSPLRLIASRFRPARLSERWRAAAIGGEGPQLFTEFAALRWLRPRTASPIRFPRPRAVHLPPEQRPRSFPAREQPRRSASREPPRPSASREPPLPSVSRDPAPSTCLPRTAPAGLPPPQPPHTRFFPRIMETDPRLRALSLRCPAPPCVALFPENKAWGGRCRQQHGGSSDETIAVGIPGRPHRVCGARPGFSRNPRLGSLRSPLSRTGRRPRRPRPR